MEIIAYGADNYIEALKDHLKNIGFGILNDNIMGHFNEGTVSNIRYIKFFSEMASQTGDGKSLPTLLLLYLSDALTEVFIRDIGSDYTNRLIGSEYSFLTEEERRGIAEDALAILNSPGFMPSRSFDGKDSTREESRRERIKNRLLEYLEENHELILEGFFRFRLKDYIGEIRNAIENAIENYLMEREYVEFINLLRYFVDLQEPQAGEVHVIMRPDGLYRLLDRDGIIIDSEYLEGFISDIIDADIDYDDLLVSALITIAPVRIVLHLGEKNRVVGTLEGIFGDRVNVCNGCEYFCVARGKNTKG